jgi:hypothetical protein
VNRKRNTAAAEGFSDAIQIISMVQAFELLLLQRQTFAEVCQNPEAFVAKYNRWRLLEWMCTISSKTVSRSVAFR